jgi:hypothetical protein
MDRRGLDSYWSICQTDPLKSPALFALLARPVLGDDMAGFWLYAERPDRRLCSHSNRGAVANLD